MSPVDNFTLMPRPRENFLSENSKVETQQVFLHALDMKICRTVVQKEIESGKQKNRGMRHGARHVAQSRACVHSNFPKEDW